MPRQTSNSDRRIGAVIDGTRVEVPADMTVLQALRMLGIHVPALCHDDRLLPIGQCWSCAIEIAMPGAPTRNCPACREPLVDGCEIRTGSTALDAFRRNLLEELAARVAPGELMRFPDKALHRALHRFGVAPKGQATDPSR